MSPESAWLKSTRGRCPKKNLHLYSEVIGQTADLYKALNKLIVRSFPTSNDKNVACVLDIGHFCRVFVKMLRLSPPTFNTWSEMKPCGSFSLSVCREAFQVSSAFIFHANKEKRGWQKGQFDSLFSCSLRAEKPKLCWEHGAALCSEYSWLQWSSPLLKGRSVKGYTSANKPITERNTWTVHLQKAETYYSFGARHMVVSER